MRVSLSITDYSWPADIGGQLGRIARAADDAGLDTLWVADHLLQADPTSTPDSEMLEAYTTLGYLAAQTQRIRLGTMVAAATFRAPALLVKAVTTLDVLSGGRAWLGIGAGHHEGEARAMGLDFPATAGALRAARGDAAARAADVGGRRRRRSRASTTGSSSRSATRSRSGADPPILIGGTGERRTLRLVARYADACNVFDIPDGGRTVRHKLDVLARHCEAVGRPFEEIEKTLSTRLSPASRADSFADRCEQIAALGIEHVVVITSGPWSKEAVATLAERQLGGRFRPGGVTGAPARISTSRRAPKSIARSPGCRPPPLGKEEAHPDRGALRDRGDVGRPA